MTIQVTQGNQSKAGQKHTFSVRVRSFLLSGSGIFVIALTLRGIYLALVAQNFVGEDYWFKFNDTIHFINVAQFFMDGSGEFEPSLLLVGPGYGFILFAQSLLVGKISAWAHLSLNLIFASLSCTLTYSLAMRLNLSRNISVLAGYILAFSITAISFSCILYAETVFVFVSLLVTHLFVSMVRSGRASDALAFTSLCLMAAMIRSVGMFYPLVFAGVMVLWFWFDRKNEALKMKLSSGLLYTLLALFLISLWPLRNYAVHGVATISETGIRAARDYWIASGLTGSQRREPIEERRKVWERQLHEKYHPGVPTLRQRHEFDASVVRDSVLAHPAAMMGAYLRNVWGNVIAESYVQRFQLPELNPLWNAYSKRLGSGFEIFLFILNAFGIATLIRRGEKETAALLGLIYLYLTLITGASFWQDSRLFLPALPFWAISCSVAIAGAMRLKRRILGSRFKERLR